MKEFFIKNWFLISLIAFITCGFIKTDELMKDRTKAILESAEATEKVIEVEEQLYTIAGLLDSQLKQDIARFKEMNKIYANMLNKDLTMTEYVQRASKEFSLDPLLLTSLINSETEFDPTKVHKNNQVSGLGGIHSKYWKIPNKTIEEQIYATAFVLNYYITKSDGDIIKALTAYKGVSEIGKNRALAVYNAYMNIKEKNADKD
jgi:hypothetical protein|uniref:Lysozyme n=1 Tax=Podoviridae sp. ctiuS14 TaxID=2827620 RepID=A0A8S5LM96_9CAUD|nr:MAG TPA: lysozyme [Podoviridae sp. ctiuS14]